MNWVDWLGWICSAGIIIGFFLNSTKKIYAAFIVWIIADIGWIIYDYQIDNWSHASLSTLIIAMNLYGIYRHKKEKSVS